MAAGDGVREDEDAVEAPEFFGSILPPLPRTCPEITPSPPSEFGAGFQPMDWITEARGKRGKIIDLDLTRMRRRCPTRLQPARELHVRKHRCLGAINTVRLARCRRPDPKIFAELSAKERGLT